MNLTTVRYTALFVIVAASVGSMFVSFIGQMLLLGAVILTFIVLSRNTNIEDDDTKTDLIRIALVWKTIRKGNVTAALLSWSAALFIFLVQVSQGRLLLDPLHAFLFFALNGCCAGAAYYLLFHWHADLHQLNSCNEMQLLLAASRERKVVRQFNLVTLPYRFACGYEL